MDRPLPFEELTGLRVEHKGTEADSHAKSAESAERLWFPCDTAGPRPHNNGCSRWRRIPDMPQTVKAPTGLSIWNAIREELMLNLYPLPYTTLPPTIFFVYLHPTDFDRIEGIVPRLVAELQQALTDEVKKINEGRGKSGGVLRSLIAQKEAPPIEVPRGGWEVHVNADRNGTLRPGHLGIDSTLPLPVPIEFGGPATTRIVKSVLTETGRS